MFNFNVHKKTETGQFNTVNIWDALIIGGGPAGLNAALYLKRKGKVVGVITKEVGGQLHNTSEVDNYLGISHTTGKALSDAFLNHINQFEIPVLQDTEVKSVQKNNQLFEITLATGKTYQSKTLLLTTGGKPRQLQIPGELEYANKGVSYCTTCDAPFFKDKHVVVAGGGNSAAESVLDLDPFVSKLTVVHRSQWRADQILLDKHQDIDKLTVHLQTQILEVFGDGNHMTGLRVLDKQSGQARTIDAEGLFIEIGTIPNSSLIAHLVETNDNKEVIVNGQQETSLAGLYAAGDVTNQPSKQIVIAVAEGAKAALAMNQYLNQ